jgi:GNAT superfamily N-acetyltransferase
MNGRRVVTGTREPERMNTDTHHYRAATPDDAPACVALRGRTRENAFSEAQLRALGITVDSWRAGIRDGSLPGQVCCVGGRIVGYCFGARDRGEIVVLALLPKYEGRGIGRVLLERVVEALRARGFERLFLGCTTDPAARSYGFYRHLGWVSTGRLDEAGDEILEWRLAGGARRDA